MYERNDMADGSKKRFLERYNRYKLGWLHDALIFVVLVVIILFIFRFLIGIAIVGGDSMEPTLHDGNIVIYARTVHRPEKEDVVSVRVPAGEYYIKRVAAAGGDSVMLRDGVLYINDKPAADPHGYGETAEESGVIIYPYAVREDNYFLLGDNREQSMDSRMFGEVSHHQIRGRVIWVIGDGGIRRVE